ncbi:BCD family MFS transporter [Sphingomonas rosea]|uniref:BCD family MFS transporter n=1 Tax=Sphingomonas rosea TaxID=335605 RepID=A0ABP7U508_9SPHN
MSGWVVILRLGAVQAAIGAMVMLATSLLNRVMVVELGLSASIPAALVAWHYAVQFTRPLTGHASDRSGRRTPWILNGMALLSLGSLAAVDAVASLAPGSAAALATLVAAFAMIGLGVGMAGTALLALLAASVPPERRAAAAATTWILMVAGIAISAGVAGAMLQPFSLPRLASVSGGLVLIAFTLSLVAVLGVEHGVPRPVDAREQIPFGAALRAVKRDPEAVRFTLFVFLSMLAYSMQDLILEPFAGLIFGAAPGQSTQYAGVQHGGVLVGMVIAGAGAGWLRKRGGPSLQWWTALGCLGSAAALSGLTGAAMVGPPWPLVPNIFLLGLANGVFAAAAIGAMMELAGKDGSHRAGVRMGVWGAAQAFAFGLGGLTGAIATDAARSLLGRDGPAFALTFAVEATLFLVAAVFAVRLPATGPKGDYQWSASTPSS